jgi:flagellar hook-basal body complex protein FliE
MALNALAASAYAATQNLGRAAAGAASRTAEAGGSGLNFSSLLQGAVDKVSQTGKAAETQAIAAANGKADIVDVVTAVAESEAALETLVAVRDRVIAAYEDIMRMPI